METQTYWPGWARLLQRIGVKQPAAVVLESAGPLVWFAAQLIYFGQPFLESSPAGGQWQALACLLESQEQSRSFAAFLREEEAR